MKFQTLATILVLGMSLAARASLSYITVPETYTSGFAANGNIPDGSTGGWSSTEIVNNITIPNPKIVDVTVTLNISGGYNGDLYAYLTYGVNNNSPMLVLLNRVGTGVTGSDPITYNFGYADAGFNNITLADSGSVNIHSYGGTGVPTGTYLPDSGGVTFASTFGGLNPNGTWTLFIADLSLGGGQSQLTSWSIGFEVVPEPVNVALAVFGALLAIPFIVRRIKSLRAVAVR